MSGISYPKPLASPTIFNPANFISNEELQTLSGVLEYPTAQGTQTFNELRLDNTSVVLGGATNTGSRNIVLGENATTSFDDCIVIQDTSIFKDGTLSFGDSNTLYKMEGMKNNVYHYEVVGDQTIGNPSNYLVVRWANPISVPTSNVLTPVYTTGSRAYGVFQNTSGRTIIVAVNVVFELKNQTSLQRQIIIDKNTDVFSSNPNDPQFYAGNINSPSGQDTTTLFGIVVLSPNDTVSVRGRATGLGTATIDASNSASDKLPNIMMTVF
tara:strand:+ start:830 stop:1633 length:804 start_codon:yes stop_codon:yes gene_type:complete